MHPENNKKEPKIHAAKTVIAKFLGISSPPARGGRTNDANPSHHSLFNETPMSARYELELSWQEYARARVPSFGIERTKYEGME
jgi:hypothetical protein